MYLVLIQMDNQFFCSRRQLYNILNHTLCKLNYLFWMNKILYNSKVNKIPADTFYNNLMFFWPCIMNWLYINYQFDALIIIYS